MNQLRKIIKETISNLLDEDYSSIKEIKELANDTLSFAAEVNFEYILSQIKEGGSIRLRPISLSDINQSNPTKYPTLKKFLDDVHLLIQFTPTYKDSHKGDYVRREKEYNPKDLKIINLYYNQDIPEEFIRKSKEYENFDYKDVYFTFWYAFHSTLEHEIQHAYDDYRSKSKIFGTRQYADYKKKYHLPSGAEVSFDDPEKEIEKHNEYLVLQHEIWARFTQAVNKTRFETVDFSKGVSIWKMNPIEDAVSDFKTKFYGWRSLSPEMKNKLISRVVQYWHKKQEALPEKNKQELKVK